MEKQERMPVTISTGIDMVTLDTVKSMTATRAAELKMLMPLAA
jgi:hypothetical protein